jgi:hypothetical protein
MKKYSIILIAAFALLLTNCKKDEIDNTATEKMAGEWYVTADAVDGSGNVFAEDIYGLGRFHLDTYNTSSNSKDTLWIDDNKNFWPFKIKVGIDLKSMTFQASDAQNEYYDSQVTISNGKILYGAATTPSGTPGDSIVFTVTFNDDSNPAKYGYAAYKVSGFRYTGFTKDN